MKKNDYFFWALILFLIGLILFILNFWILGFIGGFLFVAAFFLFICGIVARFIPIKPNYVPYAYPPSPILSPLNFCPKCGKENFNLNQFCGNCGIDLKRASAPPQNHPASGCVNWPLMIIGVVVIVAIYVFPVIPISHLGSVTLSRANDLCNSIFFTCNGSYVPGLYLGLWAAGITLILFGAFTKK